MTAKDAQYGIGTCQTGCTIYERDVANPKQVEISPGTASATEIKSIAYQLLAMVGE